MQHLSGQANFVIYNTRNNQKSKSIDATNNQKVTCLWSSRTTVTTN